MQELRATAYVTENLTFVEPEASVFKVYEMMKKNQIHHVPVIANGDAIGIISDRDLQFVTVWGNNDMSCNDIMTKDPLTVDTNTPVTLIAKLMLEKKINSVLIHNENKKVVGIFTTSDALKLIGDLHVEEE